MKRATALLLAVLVWLYAADVMAALVTKWLKQSAQTTLLNTQLDSIANNAYTAASSAIDFSVGQSTRDGYLFCSLEGNFTFAGNPTANSSITVWLLTADDGTNYENTPTSSIGLGRRPDADLPVTTGQAGTRVRVPILCPNGLIKAVAKNNGTGQTLNGSGVNFIKVLPFTPEAISQ